MASNISATIRINDAFSGPLSKLQAGLGKSASTMSRFKSALNGGMNSSLPGKMAGGFNNLNGSVGKTGGLFKSMLGANIVGAGVTKGISMITSNLDSAIQRVDTLNNATRSFQNMGFSAKQTASAMGFLDKSITGLPTSMDSAVRNTQLLAASTNNIGKSTKIYKAMNDGILGFGGSANQVDTAVTQLSQAFSNGKIDMATWNSMINGGMGPALNSIAKTMDMTTGQLKSGLSTGKVSVKDFQDALIKLDEVGGGGLKSLGKIAQDSTKGLGTSMTNFSTAVVRAMASVLDALADAGLTNFINQMTNGIKAGIPKIVSMMKEIVTAIVPILEGASKAVDSFFKSFADSGAFTAVGKALGSIGNTIGSVFSKLSSGGGKDPFAMFKGIGDIAGSAIKGAAKGIKALADVIGDLDPGSIKILAGVFIALKASTKGLVFTAIVAGLTALSKLDPGVLNGLAKAVGLLAIAFFTFKALGNVMGILDGIGNSIRGLGSGGGLDAVSKSAPQAATGFIKLGASLLLVGGAVLLAGAGLWLIASATTQLVAAGWPAVAMFFGMIVAVAALAAVVTLLGPALISGSIGFVIFGAALVLIGTAVLIASAGIALLATQLPTIATYGASAALNLLLLGGAMAAFGVLSVIAALGLTVLGAGLLIAGIGFAVAAVGAILFGAAMLIVSVGVTIASVGMMILAVALPLVAAFAMVAAVGMLLMGTAMVIVAAVAMIAGAGMMIFALALVIAAPLMMIAAAGALALGAASIVLGAGMVVAGAGLMVVAAGLRAVISAVSAMVSAFISGVARLVSGVTSGMASVVSAVQGGMQRAVGAARSFAGALFSAGVNLIQGLVNGIKSMIGSAVSAVASVASKVVSAAKGALGIHSPSTVFAEIGGYLVQGFANGITDSSSLASGATSSMAKTAISAMDSLNHLPAMTPGDILAAGYNRATEAVIGLVSAMQGVGGQTIGVNGNLSASNSGVPQSSPFTTSSGTTSTVTNSNYSDNSSRQREGSTTVTFAEGAIQATGGSQGKLNIDQILSGIEERLIDINERRG